MTAVTPTDSGRRGGPRRQRTVARLVHIVVGLAAGTYIYAPDYVAAPLQIWLQVIGIPAIVLTGVFMWQQSRIRRVTRRLRGDGGR